MDDTGDTGASQPLDRPDDWDGAEDDNPSQPESSLTDDVTALFEDGKTYVEAELAYQKTRAAFAFDRGKSGAIFVLGAVAFIHLALIALVVGLVIALTPLIGPWFATLAIVGMLLLGAVILFLMARGKFGELSSSFGDDDK